MGAILVCNPTVIIVEIGGVCLGDYESVVLAALFNVGFMVGTYVCRYSMYYMYVCMCVYYICIHTIRTTYTHYTYVHTSCVIPMPLYTSVHVSSRVYVCIYNHDMYCIYVCTCTYMYAYIRTYIQYM